MKDQLIMDRRKFLTTAALFAGPAIVRASSLMPIHVPNPKTLLQVRDVLLSHPIQFHDFLIGTDLGPIYVSGVDFPDYEDHVKEAVYKSLAIPSMLLRHGTISTLLR